MARIIERSMCGQCSSSDPHVFSTSSQSSMCSPMQFKSVHRGNSCIRLIPPYATASVRPWNSMWSRRRISKLFSCSPSANRIRLRYMFLVTLSTKNDSNIVAMSQALTPSMLLFINQAFVIGAGSLDVNSKVLRQRWVDLHMWSTMRSRHILKSDTA